MAAVAPQSEPAPASLARELMTLHWRSTRTLTRLDRACEDLRKLEDELESFLCEYYAQVGALVEELQALEDRLGAAPNVPAPESPAPLPGIDAQAKQLYRQLVRRCHPDIAGEEQAGTIRELNAAYAQRNIGELWKLQWEIERQENATPHSRIAALKSHCDNMQQALDSVQQRRQALLNSPAYALMQRAFHLRLCGQDFIAEVKAHLSRQIAQTRYRVMKMRVV